MEQVASGTGSAQNAAHEDCAKLLAMLPANYENMGVLDFDGAIDICSRVLQIRIGRQQQMLRLQTSTMT